MRRAFFIRIVFLLLAACLPPAAMADTPIVTDSRIKTFVYNPNEVFTITTHYGYQSNIEFGDKETIDTVSVGDRVAWQIIPAGRRLFIRAMEENAHTNMTIVTNLRAYQFDLRSSSADAVFGSEELTYVVRFFYPEEAAAGMQPPAQFRPTASAMPMQTPMPMPIAAPMAEPASPPSMITPASITTSTPMPVTPTPYSPMAASPQLSGPLATGVIPDVPADRGIRSSSLQAASAAPGMGVPPTITATPLAPPVSAMPAPVAQPLAAASPAPTGPFNYRYTYSGPSSAAPVKIYDDGRTTYFKYRTETLPNVSVITARGQQLAVPARQLPGNIVAVDVVGPRFSLNQPGGQVIVYNEAGA